MYLYVKRRQSHLIKAVVGGPAGPLFLLEMVLAGPRYLAKYVFAGPFSHVSF